MWRHNEAKRWLVETGAAMHRKINLGPLTVTRLMFDFLLEYITKLFTYQHDLYLEISIFQKFWYILLNQSGTLQSSHGILCRSPTWTMKNYRRRFYLIDK